MSARSISDAVCDYHKIKIVFGHRQSGKTEVIRQVVVKEPKVYIIEPAVRALDHVKRFDLMHAHLMTIHSFAQYLEGRITSDAVYCFDEFLSYPDLHLDDIFTRKFKSVIFTSTPDLDLLFVPNYQKNLTFLKNMIISFGCEVAFFELKSNKVLNDTELSVYNSIITDINDLIERHCIEYTKFDIILGDDYEDNGD